MQCIDASIPKPKMDTWLTNQKHQSTPARRPINQHITVIVVSYDIHPPIYPTIQPSNHPYTHTRPKPQTRTARMAAEELREGLKGARRVVIKAGTSVVSTPEGYPSLVRLANIVEQVRW